MVTSLKLPSFWNLRLLNGRSKRHNEIEVQVLPITSRVMLWINCDSTYPCFPLFSLFRYVVYESVDLTSYNIASWHTMTISLHLSRLCWVMTCHDQLKSENSASLGDPLQGPWPRFPMLASTRSQPHLRHKKKKIATVSLWTNRHDQAKWS